MQGVGRRHRNVSKAVRRSPEQPGGGGGDDSESKVQKSELMEFLEGLRRAGALAGAEENECFGSESLLNHTLGDTEDTLEQLQRRVEELQSVTQTIDDLGGTRHATACLARRTLAVAKRKLCLLSQLADSRMAFEGASAKKDRLLEAAARGISAPTLLGGAAHFLDCITTSIHDGAPEDADKTLFDHFCSSFGLPAQHRAIVEAKAVFGREIANWIDALVRKADDLATTYRTRHEVGSLREDACRDSNCRHDPAQAIRWMLGLVTSFGVSGEQEQLQHVSRVALGARFTSVMFCVQLEQDRDSRSAATGSHAQSATMAAERIEAAVQSALKFGVHAVHLRGATTAALDLRAEAVRRLAVSEINGLADNPAGSSDACEAAAMRVEAAIADAVHAGVGREHPHLAAAWASAKQAHQEGALRRRSANSAQRRAAAREVG